jgi:Mlc titration factor MtfA (ptsG expression regulator)
MDDSSTAGSIVPLLILAALAALFIAWLAWQPRLVQLQRRRLRARPFPDAWREILKRRVPYVRHMPADLQLQLKKHIQVFLAEKAFIGCAGLVITDEIRVTIAAQACLLILNRPTDYYPELRQILVYPGAFRVNHTHMDEAGVMQAQGRTLSGESWSQGQVILSWRDTVEGAAIMDDAYNVVIHEFAHQLDSEKGYTSGAPILEGPHRYARWSRVMQRAYDRLCAAVDRREHTYLDPYAATDPAEFFAVVSEAFFEQPADLAHQHPDIYEELRGFYRINPLVW